MSPRTTRFKTLIERTVPPRMLLGAPNFAYRGLDWWEHLRGVRDPLVPPRHLMYDGRARFVSYQALVVARRAAPTTAPRPAESLA